MKNTKRLLSAVLVVVMIVMCMFVVSSCNKDKDDNKDKDNDKHTHSYTDKVTAPTCEEQGYTTHSCSCGDSYVDTYVPAKGHNYTASIETYPTADVAGSKKHTCADCGKSYTEAMQPLSVNLPSVSTTIAQILGEGTFTLGAKEGSTFIFVNEVEGASVETHLTLNVAEFTITVANATPTGHFKLEFGFAEKENGEQTFAKAGSLYVYLNGDAVSVEIVGFDGEKETTNFSINTEFYKLLAQAYGMTVDQLASVMYIVTEVETYLPKVVMVIGTVIDSKIPEISEAYLSDLAALFNLVGEDIINVEVDEDGNATYSLDLAALNAFVESVENKTIAQILDHVYGEGSAVALTNFLNSIPDMTVMQIADNAIAISENFDMDLNDVYALIDYVVYTATGAKINVANEITSRYHMTLAEVVAEIAMESNPNLVKEDIINSLKSGISNTINSILPAKVDDLINMISGTTEGASVLGNIKAMINSYADAIQLEIAYDAEGNLIGFAAGFASYTLTVDIGDDGSVNAVCTYQGYTVNASANQNGITVEILDVEGAEVAAIVLNVTTTTEESTEVVEDKEVTNTTVTVVLDGSITVSGNVVSTLDATLIDGVLQTGVLVAGDVKFTLSTEMPNENMEGITFTASDVETEEEYLFVGIATMSNENMSMSEVYVAFRGDDLFRFDVTIEDDMLTEIYLDINDISYYIDAKVDEETGKVIEEEEVKVITDLVDFMYEYIVDEENGTEEVNIYLNEYCVGLLIDEEIYFSIIEDIEIIAHGYLSMTKEWDDKGTDDTEDDVMVSIEFKADFNIGEENYVATITATPEGVTLSAIEVVGDVIYDYITYIISVDENGNVSGLDFTVKVLVSDEEGNVISFDPYLEFVWEAGKGLSYTVDGDSLSIQINDEGMIEVDYVLGGEVYIDAAFGVKVEGEIVTLIYDIEKINLDLLKFSGMGGVTAPEDNIGSYIPGEDENNSDDANNDAANNDEYVVIPLAYEEEVGVEEVQYIKGEGEIYFTANNMGTNVLTFIIPIFFFAAAVSL